MKVKLGFIFSREYDFTDPNTNKRMQGVSCRCFEFNSGKIVKVSTDVEIPAKFGEILEVDVKLDGDKVKYEYVA